MTYQTLEHEFVEHFPEQLQEGILYVSVQSATAAHRCCYGCGNDVYTPLSPTRRAQAWLGDRESNPDSPVQSRLSYH